MTIMDAVLKLLPPRFRSAQPPRPQMDTLRQKELEAERARDAELAKLEACREEFDTRAVRRIKQKIASQKMAALELKKEMAG